MTRHSYCFSSHCQNGEVLRLQSMLSLEHLWSLRGLNQTALGCRDRNPAISNTCAAFLEQRNSGISAATYRTRRCGPKDSFMSLDCSTLLRSCERSLSSSCASALLLKKPFHTLRAKASLLCLSLRYHHFTDFSQVC